MAHLIAGSASGVRRQAPGLARLEGFLKTRQDPRFCNIDHGLSRNLAKRGTLRGKT